VTLIRIILEELKMTFDEWTKKQGFTEEDLAGPLHELECCWHAAQVSMRERCAAVCEAAGKGTTVELVCN
jgi:hypothetical protein